jgi:hypothetical protein
MTQTKKEDCVISGFRREVNGNGALLGYYAATSGNFLPTFRFVFPIQVLNRKECGYSVYLVYSKCANICSNFVRQQTRSV